MQLINTLKKAAVTCCLLSGAQLASAGTISIDPTTTLGEVGDTISVDLVWSGAPAEYLGDWDVDLTFDDSILSYQSLTTGFGVDSFGCFPGFSCDSFLVGNTIDAFEFSLDSIIDLTTNQDSLGNNFVLATIEFLAIADGISNLSFSAIGNQLGTTFGDEFGSPISPTLNNGQVCIGANGCGVAAVPTPESLPLVLIGLMAFGGLRLRKQYQAA